MSTPKLLIVLFLAVSFGFLLGKNSNTPPVVHNLYVTHPTAQETRDQNKPTHDHQLSNGILDSRFFFTKDGLPAFDAAGLHERIYAGDYGHVSEETWKEYLQAKAAGTVIPESEETGQ